MSILTYIIPEAEAEAKRHARFNELKSLLIKIEEEQSLALLSPFSDRRFFKKYLGRDYRILFSRHVQGEHTLLCVFAFKSRGDKAYDTLWQRIKFDADNLYSHIEAENSTHFAKRVADFEHHPEPPRPPEPDEREFLWLSCGGKLSQQVIVLETEAWMNAQAKDRFVRSGNAIHRLLQEQVYTAVDSFLDSGSHVIPYLKPSYLDGEDFRVNLQYFPAYHLLLLLALTEKDVEEPVQVFTADVEREALIQKARRAYPLDVFLLNSGEFAQIQKQQEGNLALSPEESDILDQVYGLRQDRFPLFINGRAGSGKSTILQYLLKDYLYLSIEHWVPEVAHTPLYLTYNTKLRDAAIAHVNKLLAANAEFMLKQGKQWQQHYASHKDEIFSRTFKLFREFLLELLPEESRSHFVPECRIGYAQFKRLWVQTMARRADFQRRYSADLVWHVLRTYIKGMAHGAGTYFTPDDYQALSRKQKTVSDADFIEIYCQLWECWYRPHCEQTGEWDDQDLALTVFADASFPRTYPAVFCDEAQDFTAIELKILYHLSLFSERSVPAYDIGHIPFVFAGDPLQTLNPTGFRWEAVKSSFHNYLLAPIERRARSKTGFNYQELLANYRSSRKIVDFCNYIQLLRLCLFGNSYGIKPQTAWFPRTDGMTPFLYSINAPEAHELLGSNALVIIPDCHEDEEDDYVNNDPLLNRVVERDEAGIPSTVLSPNMAKGLEYDEVVVLYRFGATCPKTLLERLKGQGPKAPGPAVTIEWEYFLNRLYVAASRARQRLVILDEPEAFQSFWGFMQNMDAEHMVRHLEAEADPQKWGGDKILVLKEGQPADLECLLKGRRPADDTAELAEKWYREGLDAEDPRLLRRARMQYQRLDQQAKAKECYAHALRLEGDYRGAADAYRAIDDHEPALVCLWTAAAFAQVAEFDWPEALQRNDLRIELASKLHIRQKFTNWEGNLADTERALRRLDTALSNGDIPHEANEGWSRAITALLDGVRRCSEDTTDFSLCWKTLQGLAERFGYAREHLATIAYKVQRFDKARALWEAAGKTGQEPYYRCVYKASTWPDTLQPLKQLRDFVQIIEDWQIQGEATDGLDESLAAILVEALIETDDLAQAIRLLSRERLVKTPQALKPLTEQLWEKRKLLLSPAEAAEAISLHLDALVETGTWGALSGVLQYVDGLSERGFDVQCHKIEQALVKRLAYSKALRDASGDKLNILSKLLHNRFWRKEDRWLPIIEREISIPEAGAAIERANWIADAINFYQWAVRLPRLRHAEYRYFESRLAACLQKTADWRRRQGKHGDEEERKLQDLKRKLGLEFVELEPDPAQYPACGVLPRWQVEAVKEAQRPTSQCENEAEQRLKGCNPGRNESAWRTALGAYAKALAENDKWQALTQDWCQAEALKKRFPSMTEIQLEAALDAVLEAIVEPLSCADAVVERGLNVHKPLSLLVARLRDSEANNTWAGCARLGIDHDIAGAAIERIGRHLDTIKFYEWALAQESTRRGRKAMAERLIVARERYVAYLQDDSDSKVRQRAEAQRRKARDLREQYRLLDVKIAKYPEI